MALRLVATGSYLPEKTVLNDQLPKQLNTSHQWIFERTGICQRHISAEHETCTFMASIAAQKAINNANISTKDIDLVLVTSTTHENNFPSIAFKVSKHLGLGPVPAFDLSAACAGFVYAIDIASSMSARYKTILIIGVERMSTILDWDDRSTCVLFGDGAGAAIFTLDDSLHFQCESILSSASSMCDILYPEKLPNGKKATRMNGREVFKYGVHNMTQVALQLLEKNQLFVQNLAYVVPHQANIRMIDMLAQQLKIKDEQLIKTVSHHANCSAASIPLALDEMRHLKPIKQNDIIMTIGVGAGFTWGANLFYL